MELNSLAKMERRGRKEGGAWACGELAAKLCIYGSKSKNAVEGSRSPIFSPYTMTLQSGSWEEAAGFLELSGQHPFLFCFALPLKTPARHVIWREKC